ncbi:MAG: hypothetical protein J0I84_07975 [Terrimonas sp.]|nr:hypothetical protein [Terrimonas sp.]OJY98270.1 MAG: hypothetical protein BGP13_11565 [Sphingobacteriales bacterium 40-81]
MKFIISLILIALLSFAFSLYLPWWSIAIVSFGVPLVIWQKPYLDFIAGFAALFLLWGGLAWYTSSANNHLLAEKIAVLVINKNSPLTLITITALAGALVAGLSALTGSLLRGIIWKKA